MFCFVVVLETQSHYVALVYPELSTQTRLASTSRILSCLSLLNSGSEWNAYVGRKLLHNIIILQACRAKEDFQWLLQMKK